MEEDDEYCVYVHTNIINNKKYVGQTCKKPEYRWENGNGYFNSTHFFNAIQKYGWDNFEHEIIATNLTKIEADNLEISLIKEFDTMNPESGYNLKTGGSHGRPSEETRKNLSESHKGQVLSEKTRRAISEANKGKKLSDETKRKISEAKFGHLVSDEARRKMSEAAKGNKNGKGFKHSEEAKEKMRKKIVQYSIDGTVIKIWNSLTEASKELHIQLPNISRCCKGIVKTAGGFMWKYLNESNLDKVIDEYYNNK